jgi:pyruvate-formate lyase-activating enzyme
MSGLYDLPYLLVADEEGNIFEDKSLRVLAREASALRVPFLEEFIPMPEGSDLFFLKNTKAIGINPNTGKIEISTKGYAVSCFVAPAHTQLALTPWIKANKNEKFPLFAYTLVGWKKDGFYVAATRIDPDKRQDAKHFNEKKINEGITFYRKTFPGNRLVDHLVKCAKEYKCPAARNLFMVMYEAPLPTSPACNSRCIGCISFQPTDSGFCSSQDRINFIPTPEEIAEIAVYHLTHVRDAVVSFGQGCEGEPLLVSDTIAESIKLIRKHTSEGIININTNGSSPEKMYQLIKAGIDSARISMNSFIKEQYLNYYRPLAYRFEDVIETIKLLRQHNKWVSINYFVFPGYTNDPEEIVELEKAIQELRFNMIQWRNFNIDPDVFSGNLRLEFNKKIQLPLFYHIQSIKKKYPWLYHGYFNPPQSIIRKYLK